MRVCVFLTDLSNSIVIHNESFINIRFKIATLGTWTAHDFRIPGYRKMAVRQVMTRMQYNASPLLLGLGHC
jgi:hypothetical protein